mgnify:CR=1 FL=1
MHCPHSVLRVLALLSLSVCPMLLSAQVEVRHAGDKISITIDGKHESDFFLASPKPFLHPLRSASGKIVSRMYPMEEREGEMKDHIHHQGLWYTHEAVNGFDFWGNHPSFRANRGDKLGIVDLVKVNETKSGKNNGLLGATFAWKSPSGELLLEENRRMVFHKRPNLRIIDVDVELVAKTDVTFGDTKEGTFAIRTAPEFELPSPKRPSTPARTGRMVNSNGVEGVAIWGKRASWVDYSAMVDGEKLGIAIFDHPKNPRHPTYWHARDYGLFAVNPFGVHDFENNKELDGSLKLANGEKVRFRYRVVIHSGDEKEGNVDALYKEYTRSVR